MWFHYVKQSPRTIAVNYCKKAFSTQDLLHVKRFKYQPIIALYFEILHVLAGYDMQFDIKYAYFNFLQSIRPSS